MDNQQPLSDALRAISLLPLERQPVLYTTSAQLLQDKQALNDWQRNIEELHQKDASTATWQVAMCASWTLQKWHSSSPAVPINQIPWAY